MAFKRVLRSPEQKEHENQESDGKGAQAVKDAPRNEGEQEISLEEDPGDPGDTLASSVFSEYKLKFVVHFPGRILKTNGTFYEEGEEPSAFEWLWGHRKAVWEFRLADIARKGDLTATVRTRWPIEWIVIIAIVVIAIVLIIIKSKPGAAEAESKPDEAKEQENPQSDNKKELSTILK